MLHFGPIWAHFGAFWRNFVAFWSRLKSIWGYSEPRSNTFGVCGDTFDVFGTRDTSSFETVGHLEGAGHDIADFGVIWGRFFFDQVFFFNFDFDNTWFGGGLDPLAVENIYFADFFFSFPLGRCNGASQK